MSLPIEYTVKDRTDVIDGQNQTSQVAICQHLDMTIEVYIYGKTDQEIQAIFAEAISNYGLSIMDQLVAFREGGV